MAESLKVLNKNYADLMEAIEASVNPETGEPDEELVCCLEDLELKREEKLQNFIRWYTMKRAKVKAEKEEIQRLQKMQRTDENALRWAEEYLNNEIGENEKFECADGYISHRTSQAVKITDGAKLPEKYFIPTVKIDKAGILKDLKEGKEIAGAEIEVRRKVQVR